MDSDDIRTVLRADPAIFHADGANMPIAEIVGSRSVLVVDGEKHRRSRGMILPAFHGDSVRKQVTEMVNSPLELLPPPRILRNVGLWRRREQNKARARALLLEEITRCRRDPNLAQRTDATGDDGAHQRRQRRH